MVTKKQKKCKQDKIRATMHEFKQGKLKTGTKAVVKSRRQALAIAIPLAERECGMRVSRTPKKKEIKKEIKIKKERL